MKYLVTGATGFIGTELCRQIVQAGDELQAFSARGTPLPDGTPTRALDLGVEQPDSQVLAGVDAVVHLAGIAHRNAGMEEYRAINHRATVELARAAATAGARAFVFLSSVKAMGPAAAEEPGTGASLTVASRTYASRTIASRTELDCNVPGDPYSCSKRDAELALVDEFSGAAMSVTILRPALVYGTNARGNLALLSRAVDKGLPRPPADGGRSMIGREDLCQLIRLLASRDKPGVSTYIAADGELYSTRRIYDALRSARALGPGYGWCPRLGWRLGCGLLDLLSRSPEPAWERLFGVEKYSGQAVCEDLKWQPRQTLESAMHASGGVV